MKIDIACQHTTLTDAIRDSVHKKFSKLSRQTDQPVVAHVVLSVEDHRQTVEATVLVDGSPHHAQGEATDLYQAMDMAVARLSRSMRKAKTNEIQSRRNSKESLRTMMAAP